MDAVTKLNQLRDIMSGRGSNVPEEDAAELRSMLERHVARIPEGSHLPISPEAVERRVMKSVLKQAASADSWDDDSLVLPKTETTEEGLTQTAGQVLVEVLDGLRKDLQAAREDATTFERKFELATEDSVKRFNSLEGKITSLFEAFDKIEQSFNRLLNDLGGSPVDKR